MPSAGATRRCSGFARTEFHHSDNPLIVAYSKISDNGDDVMLMVVSLDPYHVQSAILTLDLDVLGLSSFKAFAVVDELSGEVYQWVGAHPYVRLEPWARVAHIFHLPDARPDLRPEARAAGDRP